MRSNLQACGHTRVYRKWLQVPNIIIITVIHQLPNEKYEQFFLSAKISAIETPLLCYQAKTQ